MRIQLARPHRLAINLRWAQESPYRRQPSCAHGDCAFVRLLSTVLSVCSYKICRTPRTLTDQPDLEASRAANIALMGASNICAAKVAAADGTGLSTDLGLELAGF